MPLRPLRSKLRILRPILGIVRTLCPSFTPGFILGIPVVIVAIPGVLKAARLNGATKLRIGFIVLIHGCLDRDQLRASVITCGAFCLISR
jgi:hypothetical protein